jgi:hypothetical protein
MKDQDEPQPPSDDSNGEEPVCIPPLFMALLHPEDYPQSVFIKALRPLWRSSTYQAILAEGRAQVRAEELAKGRAEGARRFLRRLGSKRFGKPDAHIDAALDAIADLERLEQLSDRVLEVTTWDELLARP